MIGCFRINQLTDLYSNESMTDLCCMSFTSKGTNEILVAGRQGTMYKIDIDKGLITSTASLSV